MKTKAWYQRSLILGIAIGILQMCGVLIVLIPSAGEPWDPFWNAMKVEIAAIFVSIVALLKQQMDNPSVSLKEANIALENGKKS